MPSSNSDREVPTLHAADLLSGESGVGEIEDRLAALDLRLSRLNGENVSLRSQLDLVRDNSSLRAAAVLSTVLSWIDGDHRDNGKMTSGRYDEMHGTMASQLHSGRQPMWTNADSYHQGPSTQLGTSNRPLATSTPQRPPGGSNRSHDAQRRMKESSYNQRRPHQDYGFDESSHENAHRQAGNKERVQNYEQTSAFRSYNSNDQPAKRIYENKQNRRPRDRSYQPKPKALTPDISQSGLSSSTPSSGSFQSSNASSHQMEQQSEDDKPKIEDVTELAPRMNIRVRRYSICANGPQDQEGITEVVRMTHKNKHSDDSIKKQSDDFLSPGKPAGFVWQKPGQEDSEEEEGIDPGTPMANSTPMTGGHMDRERQSKRLAPVRELFKSPGPETQNQGPINGYQIGSDWNRNDESPDQPRGGRVMPNENGYSRSRQDRPDTGQIKEDVYTGSNENGPNRNGKNKADRSNREPRSPTTSKENGSHKYREADQESIPYFRENEHQRSREGKPDGSSGIKKVEEMMPEDTKHLERSQRSMADLYKELDLAKLLANLRPNRRILGEIAFQLDKRILNYIFNGNKEPHEKKRFYGYIIQNIPEKIVHESVDPTTGMLDRHHQAKLQYRYDYVLHSLRPLGYRIEYHPDVCADLVNKYGLLPIPSDRSLSQHFSFEKAHLLADHVMQVAPPHMTEDIIVILDCLALLARDDGKPLILW